LHSKSDWYAAQKELTYENLKSIYPKEVMDASTFIIEDYLEGEEFAADAYFNAEGEVVILNILHHKFSSSTDVSDLSTPPLKALFANTKTLLKPF
jgi:phosphoribosylamine-glycine ligase